MHHLAHQDCRHVERPPHPHRANRPYPCHIRRRLGDFDDWIAAGLREGGANTAPCASARRPAAGSLAPTFGAVLHANNVHEPHHAFRWGTNAWGVQFHPVFSGEALQTYLGRLGPTLAREGQDVAQISAGVKTPPKRHRYWPHLHNWLEPHKPHIPERAVPWFRTPRSRLRRPASVAPLRE